MSESNELVVLNNLNPVSIFTENGADPLLEAIKKEVSSFVPDISTVKGRKEIASLANKVAKSKVYLDDLGKDLVSEWKEKSKKVDLERKKIRDSLDLLKEEVRRPLTEFEENEEMRLKRHEANISHIESYKNTPEYSSSELVSIELETLTKLVVDSTWEEFQSRASMRQKESILFLQELLSRRLRHEAEQLELMKFREAEELRLKTEREERIAQEAATKARAEAERLANESALKAKMENERLEKEKQEAINKQKVAEENARIATERAAQEKAASEKRAVEAAAKAEKDKKEAELKAIELEMQRAAKIRQQEEDERIKREANLKHRKNVNNEALQALVREAGLSEETAKEVVKQIALGVITNVKISY